MVIAETDDRRPAAGLPALGASSLAPAARGGRWLLGVGLILVALNLRPVFSSLSAVLPEVQRATGAGAVAAGTLTTLPVLCMGLFAPLAPRLAVRLGAERTLWAALLVLLAGTALRGAATLPALLAGAVLAGSAIAVGNVLLPGLVKRDFPDRLAPMTGAFTMALSGGAAAAAGLTVPLQRAFGGSWAAALAAWAVPVALALAVWSVAAWRPPAPRPARQAASGRLWRDPLAWQVSLFMGLQSAMAYCIFGFLAPTLRERGLDGGTAGAVVALSVAVQCVACLLAPSLAVRRRRQSGLNVAFFALALASFLACAFGPLGAVWVAAAAQGFGQGGLIALAMTAIVLRSPDAGVAADLSGMAQGVGYTVAAAGPLLFGLLHGLSGGLAAPAVLFALLAAGGSVCGFKAGRDHLVLRAATSSRGP